MRSWKVDVYNYLQYLRSICTGLTSQSSLLLGLMDVVSSWKFSKVDIMSWTCRFSSRISCNNWDTDEHQKAHDSFLLHLFILSGILLMPSLPAATSAGNCCPALCTHIFWFVLAIRGTEHWLNYSFPARRIHEPASHSHWSLVNSWFCGNTGSKLVQTIFTAVILPNWRHYYTRYTYTSY